MWMYEIFRRDPASPRTPDEWIEALLGDGWETWCGRGAWTTMNGEPVYGVWLRRFEPKPGGPTREETLTHRGAA